MHIAQVVSIQLTGGSSREVFIYPDHPDQSDDLDEGFVLLGPIPVPEELT